VAPRLSPLVGGPARRGQRQHRRAARGRLRRAVPAYHPGLGYTLIAAINTSDYLLVQGIVFTVCVGVVVLNFFFDFVINLVDPRISRE
jgi:hypothetical protein